MDIIDIEYDHDYEAGKVSLQNEIVIDDVYYEEEGNGGCLYFDFHINFNTLSPLLKYGIQNNQVMVKAQMRENDKMQFYDDVQGQWKSRIHSFTVNGYYKNSSKGEERQYSRWHAMEDCNDGSQYKGSQYLYVWSFIRISEGTNDYTLGLKATNEYSTQPLEYCLRGRDVRWLRRWTSAFSESKYIEFKLCFYKGDRFYPTKCPVYRVWFR